MSDSQPEKHGDAVNLVVCPGALGDTILRLQAISVLRAHKVLQGSLWLVGTSEYLASADCILPGVHVSSFEDAPWSQLFSAGSGSQSGLCQRLRGVARALVWLPEEPEAAARLVECGVGEVTWADPNQYRRANEHQILALVRTVGLGAKEVSQCFPISTARQGPGTFRRILMHSGAGSPRKRLATEFYQRVAEMATSLEGEVTWLVGPAELEGPYSALPHVRRIRVRSGLSIREVVRVIEKTDCVIGNDSGVLHLAAALGKPVVSIFVSTSPEVWHPLGPAVAVVDVRLGQRPLRFFSGLQEVVKEGVSPELIKWSDNVQRVARECSQ